MISSVRRALLCVALLPLAACSEVLDSSIDPPDEAEVTVSGTSPVPLTLIMSSRFIGVWNPDENKWDVTLHQSDTVTVSTLPISRRLAMNETGVFFVRLTNADDAQTASITMRVRIDGQEVYTQAATMRDASLEYVYFTR